MVGNPFCDAGYVLCPDPSGSATVTTEPNGDITVDCASQEVLGFPGIFNTWQIRLYATENNGYLARQLITFENTTGVDVPLSTLLGYWYPAYVQLTNPFYLTDSGQTVAPLATDSWFTSGSSTGNSVIWTSAWAKTGNTAAGGLRVAPTSSAAYTYVDYSGLTVAADSTQRILQFTNMVIPASEDEAGADAARAAAATQTAEFATFCGRLVDGLDANAYYAGWGTPADCNPVLPATGSSVDGLWFGAVAAFALGGVLLTVRRRTRTV